MSESWLIPALVLSALLLSAKAHAAELRFAAPPECAVSDGVREQVQGLTGGALAEVEGIDFELEVQKDGSSWNLILRTLRRGESTAGTRRLSGSSCAEVTDAAAVAIAMAVNERPSTEAAASASETATDAPRVLAPEPPAQPAPASLATPLASRPPRSSTGFSTAAALDGVLDIGALPNPAPGVELGLSAGFPRVKLVVVGSAFAAQQARLDDGKGGEFRLLLGGLLGCAQQRFGHFQGTACGGAELGQVSAEGLGVQRPRFGNGRWRAIRAEIGVSDALTAGVSLVLRLAAIVPLERPEFVVDGAQRVHRSSSVTGRALVGIELQL